jgi:hypothetical protein
MKFKVLKTFKASLDGFNLADFNIGEILEENDNRLTKHFLTWASANKGFIEEFIEEAKDVVCNDTYLHFCIAGKTYTNKEGYPAYDCYLPKMDNKKYKEDSDDS